MCSSDLMRLQDRDSGSAALLSTLIARQSLIRREQGSARPSFRNAPIIDDPMASRWNLKPFSRQLLTDANVDEKVVDLLTKWVSDPNFKFIDEGRRKRFPLKRI